jgi:hypothetical protein
MAIPAEDDDDSPRTMTSLHRRLSLLVRICASFCAQGRGGHLQRLLLERTSVVAAVAAFHQGRVLGDEEATMVALGASNDHGLR